MTDFLMSRGFMHLLTSCVCHMLLPLHLSFLSSVSLRFSIDPQSDPEALFRITPDTGLITTVTELDREHEQWHNITIIATQRGTYTESQF